MDQPDHEPQRPSFDQRHRRQDPGANRRVWQLLIGFGPPVLGFVVFGIPGLIVGALIGLVAFAVKTA